MENKLSFTDVLAVLALICAGIGFAIQMPQLYTFSAVGYCLCATMSLFAHPVQGPKLRHSIRDSFSSGGPIAGFFAVGVAISVACVIGIVVIPIKVIVAIFRG
ncbi:MAG: hypothetical protein Q4A24_03320 [Akkermansia sp.]|nr:hypothetical protein [Akkermansia sp.]MDO4751115.1 hypothetical protein [Akkermansia sp.]